jgi:hypothetical protein
MALFARQRARYEERCPDALDHYDRLDAAGPAPDYVEGWERCSGDVECPTCGEVYYDHPPHPFVSYFHVTCAGEIVKL